MILAAVESAWSEQLVVLYVALPQATSVQGTYFELCLEIIDYIFEYSFIELYASSMEWIVKRQNIYPYIFVLIECVA